MDYDKIIDSLSLEDLCAQLLCVDISDKADPTVIEEMLKTVKPGGIFVAGMSAEKIKYYKELANKYCPLPLIVSADVEFGPGSAIKGLKILPHPMAWGACDDSELVEEAGYLTAKISKLSGIDYTFSPMVNLSLNPNSPPGNVRLISSDPDLVIKIGGAYLKGLRRGGLTAAVKSFPDDTVDDRNPHFCTTENFMTREELDKTSIKIFREMFNMGAESIMVGHGALPAIDDYKDELGYLPGILSEKIMTGVLKQELGFNGCIVSDALSMIGACSRLPAEDLAVEYVKCGGDMVLFPEKHDKEHLVAAVKSGKLKIERVKDAVKRIIKLKEQSNLFDNKPIDGDIEEFKKQIDKVGVKIAEKSLNIIRDRNNAIKNGIKKGDRVLNIYLFTDSRRASDRDGIFDTLEQELKDRGCTVDVKVNPSHYELENCEKDYDAVLICAKFLPSDYGCGASLRMGWESMHTFWRGYVLRHPKMIFTSFGDPYKIYEIPFIKTYINAFSPSTYTQQAFAKLLFGEILPTAKSPIELKGFLSLGE